MTFDDVLARLEGVRRASDTQAHARCPAHDDRQASLTVGVGHDGRVLLTCWTGCELDDICRALRIEVRDLFPNASERERSKLFEAPTMTLSEATLPTPRELAKYGDRLQRAPEVLAMCFEEKGWSPATLGSLGLGLIGADIIAIPMRELDGKLVNLLRYRPRPHGRPKMLAEQGRPRIPLYLLFDDDAPVWIVEGEPDAISIAGVGLNAIGAPGASAKAHAHWLDVVRDRDVVVCFDTDEPGHRAALRWARVAFTRGARSVKIVELDGPKGYDVGELVREQRASPAVARRQLIELARAARPFVPQTREQQSNGDRALTLAPEVDELKPGELILRPLSSVRSRALRMLWRGRIPVGRVGIIFGPPGQGKSTLTSLLVSDITRAGGRVLIASAEDVAETTIRPRLIAADADIDRVTLLSTRASKGETSLVLPRDLDVLGASMRDHSLVLIDPLSAHLGDDVNAWSEQSVRHLVLAPLSWYANRTDCSVALIMHINKSDRGDALGRISGSGGFGGAARFAMLLGSHPDDVGRSEGQQRLVLVHVKASESARMPALVFRRTLVDVDVHESDELVQLPTLELVDDEATISAEQVLAVTDPDEAGAFSEAITWLQVELGTGPKLAKRLLATARERGDFSERTLRKAKRALRVRSTKDTEGWWWERP